MTSPIGAAAGTSAGLPVVVEPGRLPGGPDTDCPTLDAAGRLAGGTPFLPPVAVVDLAAGVLPAGEATLVADETEALGIAITALQLGQLPFLPAC
ncbi:MAG TPA: hypothetical protein VGX78_15080 [Pirellulales bacterium]|nr:hypothetical protein [Pirellulales bacterium]